MVVENSHLYARSKGNTSCSTIPHDVRASYLFRATVQHLVEICTGIMTRKCIHVKKPFLHVSDNANLQADKIRPLLSMLNEIFIHYFEFLKTQNLSIDQSMVPYYGRQSAKQCIRGKPIRFGYKMWVLTPALGMWCSSSLTNERKGGKHSTKDLVWQDL